MSEAAIETEIQAKGLSAPRLTPEAINAQIYSEVFVTGLEALAVGAYVGPGGVADGISNQSKTALGCLTICVLTMKNGYTIVGKSACASPENFDVELGRTIAREDARRQIWALEGYLLRSKLATQA